MTGQETTTARTTQDSGPASVAGPGPLRPQDQLVTIYGGSGFLGRHVVRALAKRGYRIRVAVRRPDLALFLQPLGQVNQIVAVQANLRYPDSVNRAAERAADRALSERLNRPAANSTNSATPMIRMLQP